MPLNSPSSESHYVLQAAQWLAVFGCSGAAFAVCQDEVSFFLSYRPMPSSVFFTLLCACYAMSCTDVLFHTMRTMPDIYFLHPVWY